ncbi:MAG: cellulase family glycosylhydrolase [Actinobacteria bacterium]|nr:cellulase family glycosylhydrolase [Actinomycetota bacterium]
MAVGWSSSAHAAETGISVQGSASTAVADANALGVDWVRRFADWNALEPSAPGVYSSSAISELDDLVSRAHAAKKKITLTVLGAPTWANGSSDARVAPRDPAQYATFIGRLAARYRGRVQSWEVWNEPDEPEFWHGTPASPASYAPLLKASYTAIKAADPAAQVVAGPLTGNNYDFVEGLYGQGAGGSFDAVGVHTDTACGINPPSVFYYEDGRVGRFSFLGFREVHAVMAAHGDGGKPITMSEMGWSTTTTRCDRGKWAGQKDAGVNEATQAAFLSQAYHCLAGYPYMTTGIWFSTRDGGAAETELNRYGLLRWNGTRRGSWAAMEQVATKGDQLTNSCGDLEPPTIKIIAPTSATQFEDQIFISASGHDVDSGLKSLQFYLNGKAVAGASVKNDELLERTLSTESLPYGPVTVKVRAIDSAGATTYSDVVVNKIRMSTLPPQKTALAFKVTGKAATKTISGRLTVPGTQLIPTGKVLVRWQLYKRKHWVTKRAEWFWVSKYARWKSSAAPFKFTQKLKAKGRWRASATYSASRPFTKASAVKTVRIR